MSANCCKTCRHAQTKGNKFECHVEAPQPLTPDEASNIKPKVVWPLVKEDDWCGRWAMGTPRP